MTMLLVIIACGLLSIVYAIWATQSVMAADQGNARMQEIAAAIQEGASAYLNRQYSTIAIAGVVIAIFCFASLPPVMNRNSRLKLPSASFPPRVMGVSTTVSSAHAFGATNFDTQAALVAMEKNASQPGTTSDGFAVRKELKDYLTLGYAPDAVSVTLEYGNADLNDPKRLSTICYNENRALVILDMDTVLKAQYSADTGSNS